MGNKIIAISITEGRIVRDWFENGFIKLLMDQKYQIKFFTPAAIVPSFTSKWKEPGVEFLILKPHFPNVKTQVLLKIRRRLLHSLPIILPLWLILEKSFANVNADIIHQFGVEKPDLAIITNPIYLDEQSFFDTAMKQGIPTLGIIRSWDNLFKGLSLRPDFLAVWNPVNCQEAIEMLKYTSNQIKIIGANQFDPYFAPDSILTREEFAKNIGFDPGRPIITIATLGNFQGNFDETYLLDWILNSIQTGKLPGDIQVVCRLHPSTRLENFRKYLNYPNIRISSIDGYIPTLNWTMTRADVIFVANLLRHSNVVISPGSTITIETAIFDTPTIVPMFHTYQPELGKIQFDNHLSKHFKRLKDLDLVPFIFNVDDLAPAVCRSLSDPSWYRNQRKQLVNDYVYYTDGKSVKRLVDLIIDISSDWNYKSEN